MINLTNKLNKVIKQFAICVRSRKEAMVYSWLSVIGLLITYRGLPPPILLLKVFFAMTGTALGVYLYNDICDLEADMTRSKIVDLTPASRPLGRGLVSKRRMGIFSALLVVLGLTASALINIEVLMIQFIFLMLGLFYSVKPIRLKRVFLMKQVITMMGGAIACLSAGLAAGTISIQLLYLTGFYVLCTAGVGPLYDLKDIESDLICGIKTIPIVWGSRFTIRLALATFTASAATMWIGFYGLGFNIVLPILGTLVIVSLVYVVYPLLGSLMDQEYVLKTLYSRVIPLMFLLQFTVFLGSLSF